MDTPVKIPEIPRVLIVEDEAIIALDIRKRLTGLGYVPLEPRCASAAEAIAECARLTPDLVLMDITLDGPMDGIEAAQIIRNRFDVPVVFLTAHADEATFARAKQAMPHGYVLKPLDDRWLNSALSMALIQHGMEQKLKESERLFRSVFDNAAAGMVLLAPEMRILSANATFAAMLGLTPEELTGKNISGFVHPDDQAASLRHFQDLVAARLPQYRMQKRYLRKDGSLLWADMAARGVTGSAGKLENVVQVMIDVTERKSLEEELRRQAHTDYLTGIANRREYFRSSQKELRRALRHGFPISILSLDLDHFKQINDTLGHTAGDEVLRRLATVCTANLREHDIFGRIGGEEFAITLVDCFLPEALEIAERLRETLAATAVATGETVARFTVSIGVAGPDLEPDLETLLQHADEALYAAKRAGRNRVEVWGG